MNIQSEIKTFDRSLQKVEFDMEWNQERSNLVRKNLARQIYNDKTKTQTYKLLGFISTLGVALTFFFLVIGQLGSPSRFIEESIVSGNKSNIEKLYTMEVINGRETLVLTEKGMEYVVYPMDAHKEIDTIVGEPSLAVSVQKKGDKEKIFTQAFYPTSNGRFISVHYSTNDTGSVEEMSKVFLPNYPLYGTNITEINITGQRAFLHEPTTEYGTAALYIVTQKYVYYLTNQGLLDKQQGDGEELVLLANLFNFEAER